MSAEITDQEKADWIEAYVDLIDPLIFANLSLGRGSKPNPPAQMFKLVIFQILKQHLSPAKWAREVHSDSILQLLIGGITPSRSALYSFRDRIGKVIDQISQSLLCQSIQHNLLAPAVAAMDGTSVRSYGSRHRIVNQKTLSRRRNHLSEVIAGDLQNKPHTKLPTWMGKTKNGRLSQLDSYDKAHQILLKRIEEKTHKRKASRRHVDKIYISLSDPESGLSRDKENVFCPMYCGQLVTDTKSLLILGSSLSNRITDVGTIGPMIDSIESSLQIKLTVIHADSAYASLMDLQACIARKVELVAPVESNGLTKEKRATKVDKQLSRDLFQFDAAKRTYTCPAGHPMPYFDHDNRTRVSGILVMERFRQRTELCQACPLAVKCLRGAKQRSICRPIGQEVADEQKAKMTDELSKTSRVLRAQTIERTHADIKQRIGARRFGLVTLHRAKQFLTLTVFVLNLMTVRRLLFNASNPSPTTTKSWTIS